MLNAERATPRVSPFCILHFALRAVLVGRPQQEPLVETAGPVALQVEGNVPVPDGLELADDGGAHVRLEGTPHLVAPNLDSREFVVMTEPEHAEPQVAECPLSALDDAELLIGDFRVIRNTGGQTRRRRFVPRGQPRASRQLTNLVLVGMDLIEGAPHTELARRLPSRSVVATSVGVVPVNDDGPAIGRDSRQMGIQLVLAV